MTCAEVSAKDLYNGKFRDNGFVCVNFDEMHLSPNIMGKLRDQLLKRDEEARSQSPDEHIYQCLVDISKHRNYLKSIQNEASVRYTFANPLVDMLCSAFGYTLELEESIKDDDLTRVSEKSKADYVLYRLYNKPEGTSSASVSESIATVIMETKHIEKLNMKAVAQVMGYYCRAKGDQKDNQSGIAVLFNEFDGNFEIQFFLFPFTRLGNIRGTGYGVQSVMLPCLSYQYLSFINSGFIKLFYLMCMRSEKAPSILDLECPDKLNLIKASQIVVVLSESEYHEEMLKERDEKINELREKMQGQDEKMKERDEKIKERDEEINELREKMQGQDEKMKERDEKIKERDEEINELREKMQGQDEKIKKMYEMIKNFKGDR